MAIRVLILLSLFQTANAAARSEPKDPRQGLYKTWIDSALALSRRNAGYALVVDKSVRYMDVFLAGRRVAGFDIALGKGEADELEDKRKVGDSRLKEGIFHLSQVAWDKTIPRWDNVWMRIHTVEASKRDYGVFYGKAGKARLAAWEGAHGPIETDADVIAFNGRNRKAPIWRGLGIHGGGTGRDWTKGCVGMERKDVRWLYRKLAAMPEGGVGTPVAIVRSVPAGALRLPKNGKKVVAQASDSE